MSVKRNSVAKAAQASVFQYDLFSALNGEDDLEALDVMSRTDNVYDQMSRVVDSVASRNAQVARLTAGNSADIANAMYLRAGGLDMSEVHDFVRGACAQPDAVMAVVAVADSTPAAQKAYADAAAALGPDFVRDTPAATPATDSQPVRRKRKPKSIPTEGDEGSAERETIDIEGDDFADDPMDAVEELTGSSDQVMGASLDADDEDDEGALARQEARDSVNPRQRLLNSLRAKRYDPMTKQETEAVAARVQQGDEAARQELIERNMRFLVRATSRYASSGRSLDDLFQVGSMGLIRAAELFDPTKGWRFTTYADYWIRQTIGRYLSSDCLIRTPVHVNDRVVSAKKRGREARAAGDLDLAAELEKKAEKIGRHRTSSTTFVGLDTPMGSDEDGASLADLLASEEMSMEQATEAKKLVTWLLRATNSTSIEADGVVVQMRMGLHPDYENTPMTFSEISEALGVSRERIRQRFERGFAEVIENVTYWAKGEENLPENFFPMLRTALR